MLSELKIETPRLLLRPPQRVDLDPWAEMMIDETTAKFIGGAVPRAVTWRALMTMIGAWHAQGFRPVKIARVRAPGHRDYSLRYPFRTVTPGISLASGYGWRELMLRTSTLSRIALLVFLGVSAAGCELVGGIFKAGMWIGALGVILVVVLLVVVVGKFKR